MAGRRAYAAGAILAVFLIGSVASGAFQELGGALANLAPFVYPLAVLDGAREWLFGTSVAGSPVSGADVPLFLYGLATAAILAVSWLVLFLRYRSIPT